MEIVFTREVHLLFVENMTKLEHTNNALKFKGNGKSLNITLI